MNYYNDSQEWQWLVKNAIDWDKILPLYYPTFPTEEGFQNKQDILNFMDEILATCGNWTANAVAPRAEKLDRQGPGEVKDGKTIPNEHLKQFYKEAGELGAFGLCLPRHFGGTELPVSIGMCMLEMVGRACIASSTQLAFYGSIGDMIERFASKELRDKYIPQITSGEISGSMCLTEPGCGSDLGAIKTSAKPVGDGTYLINGSKIFISNGGGGLGLVLARLPEAPAGLEGISMFLVDQRERGGLNFKVVKNEEKLGLHGSFTCEVLYENTVGRLVGQEHQGFKLMLHLMNEARLATGLQALGGIESSLSYAIGYAQERHAFGRPIAQLPLLKRNIEDYETERDALRALLVDTLSHYDIFQRLHLKKEHNGELTQAEEALYKDARLWTRKRTPLVKYYATETFTLLSQRAIQMLGGFGFMREYPVERIHRDSFAPLLYEGTSQIQALMALKDVVKFAVKDPKKFFSNVLYKHPTLELLNRSNEWTWEYRSVHYNFKKKMVALLFNTLKPETSKMWQIKNWAKIDEEKVGGLMIHAETLCQALSYMETLRVLCEHANKDAARAPLFHRYRRLVVPRLEAIYSDWSERTH